MKLKFKVPFKKLLEKYSIDTSSNVDGYVQIVVVEGGQLSYEFSDKTSIDLQQFLFILGFKPTFKNVFPPNVDVKITAFDVNLQLQTIEVTLETTSGIVVGNNVLSLEKAVVSLKRIQNGVWIVKLTSDMKLGECVMKVVVSQVDDQYSLTGKRFVSYK